ncbi:hypothetical protein VOLCADRAFT_92558 [Volvox carteri f. nagariensis]|uniref:Uncharacterized protein n=1 Tax=Volvox carteri f. nagariensis TaxID=3068 RepID=D8TZZ4_VOLCA|nr:uncharacterized protein VOLCADRAFT_92558 [Volvox carteri f. nagariensis]EFJ47018.1 hypothetical protein VOLCADRAFT_92558 [Volvox carteri f. nagariensis]|eukprot:XP_002951913.1 hypothetical protein VOLCADRAFT_92558 [Volvox carteri f. nagariensis]
MVGGKEPIGGCQSRDAQDTTGWSSRHWRRMWGLMLRTARVCKALGTSLLVTWPECLTVQDTCIYCCETCAAKLERAHKGKIVPHRLTWAFKLDKGPIIITSLSQPCVRVPAELEEEAEGEGAGEEGPAADGVKSDVGLVLDINSDEEESRNCVNGRFLGQDIRDVVAQLTKGEQGHLSNDDYLGALGEDGDQAVVRIALLDGAPARDQREGPRLTPRAAGDPNGDPNGELVLRLPWPAGIGLAEKSRYRELRSPQGVGHPLYTHP